MFDTAFSPLYPQDFLDDLATLRSTRPSPCTLPGSLAQLDSIAETFKQMAPSLLEISAVSLDDSDASVHRLGIVLSRDRRDALLAEHTQNAPRVPLLAMVAIHGAIYVGRCAVRNHGGSWLMRRPLWESTVWLPTRLGDCELHVFPWWLKSLSDDEIDRLPLGARYRNHVEMPCFDATSLPVIAPGSPVIPRLNDPRYDRVVAHLAEHAPQIAGLGAHFPRPDRFAQYSFMWLDFQWIGEGRLLLVHGPATRQGAQLFWFDGDGFSKAAFYPSDDFPTHKVRLDGDMLRVIVSVENAVRYHDLPWWGL